jgi:hypothetical protein
MVSDESRRDSRVVERHRDELTVSLSIAQRANWTVAAAIALAGGAMIQYPGGTMLDAATSRYSFSRNFLSDLGMTVAYDGQPNQVGAALFVLSLLVLVAGLGSCLLDIARQLSAYSAARRWTRAAAVCGVLACAAFTGVAVTPENRVMALHVIFTMWGWRVVPVITGLFAVASLRASPHHRRAAVIWVVATGLLAGYVAVLSWGPSPLDPSGLIVQVIAQKVAASIVLLTLLISVRSLP